MSDKYRGYRNYLFAGQKAPGTIEQRVGDLERFERTTDVDAEMATSSDLFQYMADGYGVWAPQYAKRIRGSLRSFYGWRFATGLADNDPSQDLPSVKIQKRRHRRPAPDDQVLEAFARGSLRERAILALTAAMGLRRNEVATLPLTARSGNELTVIGKGSKERVLELDDLTKHLLVSIEREAPPGMQYYFPGRFPGTHLHPQTVYSYVKNSLPDESPHTLRHRAGTVGYRRTKDIRATQEFLGHASLATTEIYVELDRTSVAAFTKATSLSTAGNEFDGIPLYSAVDLMRQATDLGVLLDPLGWSMSLVRKPSDDQVEKLS